MPFFFAVEKFLILNELYFFADRFDEDSLCILGHTDSLHQTRRIEVLA